MLLDILYYSGIFSDQLLYIWVYLESKDNNFNTNEWRSSANTYIAILKFHSCHTDIATWLLVIYWKLPTDREHVRELHVQNSFYTSLLPPVHNHTSMLK